jgi:mRNA interferase RelE/StbE
MYQILVARSAEKDLLRLPVEMRPKLVAAIRPLAENPRPPGSRKLVGSVNDWRIRVGNYRIIYEIADDLRIVRIYRIRHRKDSYR